MHTIVTSCGHETETIIFLKRGGQFRPGDREVGYIYRGVRCDEGDGWGRRGSCRPATRREMVPDTIPFNQEVQDVLRGMLNNH